MVEPPEKGFLLRWFKIIVWRVIAKVRITEMTVVLISVLSPRVVGSWLLQWVVKNMIV